MSFLLQQWYVLVLCQSPWDLGRVIGSDGRAAPSGRAAVNEAIWEDESVPCIGIPPKFAEIVKSDSPRF